MPAGMLLPRGCLQNSQRAVWAMSRQPVRLITMAWGKKYIDELVSLTLPAILAPNNLPELAAHFACELVIVTEEAWFERLRQHWVYARLQQYCSIELRPIDDLVNQADAYGLTLTYALFRGFEELGPAMVDRQLIFFNADFILADGALRSVGEKIRAGERLILAPSYCVVSEKVMPWLSSRIDDERGYLAVSPREMAAAALRNRHNTIRGKTVNQRAFSVEWMDQFYWLVDEQTLIGHQLPFAVVSMRPERVLTDMCTFWDYGIISEACPTTPRCVLADSDDFLMIELRTADTARDQLRLGWPEPKEIAGRLKQFVTKDPIELARYTLMLHSGDLPAELDDAKAKLDRFVASVLAELPAEPTHWANHPIWAYHYPHFHQAREAFLGRRTALATGGAAGGATGGANAVAAVPEQPSLASPVSASGPKAIARRLYYRYFGRAPWLRPIHPRWADVQPVLNALQRHSSGPALVISSSVLSVRLFRNLVARHMSVSALGLPRPVDALFPTGSRPMRVRIGGDRPILAEVTLDGQTAPQKLHINSLEMVWEDGGRSGAVAPPASQLAEMPAPAQLPPAEKHSVCILELNVEDLHRLPQLLDRVARWMQPGGKILVFHINSERSRSASDLIGEDGLWLDMPYAIHFVGSKASQKAINAFHHSVAGLRMRRPVQVVKSTARLAGACLAALRVSRAEVVDPRRDPAVFTSLTIEIEMLPGTETKGVSLDEARAVA